MEATELFCDAVYSTVQDGSNFESTDEILSVTIQMKATEQYFPVVLFIVLYKVFLNLREWIKL